MESLDRVETLVSGPPCEPSFNNNDELEEEEEEEEDECEDDEEEDVDFNPFLKGSPSREASSSLSSEAEAIDGEIVNSVTQGKEKEIPMQSNVSCEEEEAIPEDSRNNVQTKDSDPGGFGREEGCLGDENMIQTQKQVLMSNEEKEEEDDAICKRTRAKYSLESFTLDDLEAFLQETDDEEDIPNVDDEEEYRKFLAAVLQSGGDGEVQLEQSGNNDEDDDEDNDLDFEIELEEALETDDEEIIPEKVREDDSKSNKRRPVTRQKRRQNISTPQKNNSSEQGSRILRPLLPILPVASAAAMRHLPVPEAVVSSEESPVNGFTQSQIGELHCLIQDHLQLLIQVYSLCALDHSRQHIGTQVQGLISDMLQQQRRSHLFVTGSASSVVDLAGRYVVDVSSAVNNYRRSQLESGFDVTSQRVPLFPLPPEEVRTVIVNNPGSSSSSSKQQSKKTLAATLVESAKKQSVALVHRDIANLAKRFLPLFKVSLFPHKAPPASVANRTLFTDAEDELLALGIMEYNSDWKAIKQRFLPCKGEHQIYVRQKNRRSSKAPENPIKAVLRMKSSPLTPQEIGRIQEGLKCFKYDWMSVWKFVVPYRDPSSLPRQWRTALGIQKSYKLDAVKKERRRIYDNRRKSREQLLSAKEDCNGASKESVDNSSEAYLHEGFLAEWRPGMPAFFYSTPMHSDVSRDRHEPLQTCATSEGSKTPEVCGTQRLVSPSSFSPLFQHPTTGTTPRVVSRAPITMLPYRSRKLHNKSVVRLAPGLPPVNLPDSVRIISQSVFAKNQSETPSKTCLVKSGVSDASGKESLGTETRDGDNNGPRSENVVDLQEDDDVPAESSSRNNDSEFEMHPLLFRTPEPHGQSTSRDTGGSSSSFSFFSDNRPQLLSLFNSPRPINQSADQDSSLNEDDAALGGDGCFHPLLQRTEYETSYHNNSRRGNLGKKGKSCQLQDTSDAAEKTSVSSKHDKNVNLDIYLSSSSHKVKDTCSVSAANTSEVPGIIQRNDGHEVAASTAPSNDGIRCIEEMGDQSNLGIVMEQEELSDSDEEMMEEEYEEEEEHVEFECEEMDDSEGEEEEEEEGEEEGEEIIEMQDKDNRSSALDLASTDVDSGKELGKDSPNSPWLSLDPSSSRVKDIEKTTVVANKTTVAGYGSSRSRRKRTLMKSRDAESKEDAGLRLGPVEGKKPKKCVEQAETSPSIETS